MQNFLKKTLATILSRTGVLHKWEQTGASQPDLLRVLMYHRVSTPLDYPNFDPLLISATPNQFEQQIKFLAENYHPVSLETLIAAMRNKHPLQPNTILVTFDDGYCDFTDHAWPILQNFRVPAVIFLPTAFPSDPNLAFWWDRLYMAFRHTTKLHVNMPGIGQINLKTTAQRQAALRHLKNYILQLPADQVDKVIDRVLNILHIAPAHTRPTLTWNQIRELHKQGLAVANHTQHHWAIGNLNLAGLRTEISNSQADLKRELGKAPPVFCYPNGQTQAGTNGFFNQLGITMAFSTRSGINAWTSVNPLQLQRIGVNVNDSLSTFRLQLTGQYAEYKQGWRQKKDVYRSVKIM